MDGFKLVEVGFGVLEIIRELGIGMVSFQIVGQVRWHVFLKDVLDERA